MSTSKAVQKFESAQDALVLQSSDLSLETIAQMVDSEAIDVAPKYQRLDRWDHYAQSELIESFLLNVPVPPVYLAEEEFGTYSVIDGKQRITTIHRFLRNQLPLSGLKKFVEVNGSKFADLPRPLQNALSIRPYLRVVTLLKLNAIVALALALSGAATHAQMKGAPIGRGAWILNKTVDKMTDQTRCALFYTKLLPVYYTGSDMLVVNLSKRGGVGSYRYRVDRRPATSLVRSRPDYRDLIELSNYDGEFFDASTLRINGLTFLDSLIDMEIDIRGLRAAREEMAVECNLPPMPKPGQTNVDADGRPKAPE